MKSLSFLLFICVSILTYGQVLSPGYINFLPSTTANPDLLHTLSTADSSGNSYICGISSAPTYYNMAQGNLTLKKIKSDLQADYSITLLGDLHVYGLATDGINNIYIALNYITQLDYESLHLTSSTASEHPVLLKLDSAGHYVWHLPLTGTNVFRFHALTLDPFNSIYIGYDNYFDSFIQKIDTNGNPLFTLTQNNVKMVSAISVDIQGNIAVAGGCSQSNLNFNGTPSTNPLLYSTYIAYYNSAQQLQWVHYVEDVTCADPDVVMDPTGNVYFTSALQDNFTVLGQTTEGPIGGEDFFLVKINPQGNLVWYREVPGNGQFRLAKKKSLAASWGQNYPAVIYVAGTTRNLVQWLPDFSTNPGNQDDILLLAYDLNGNLIHHTIGGSSTGDDRLDCISINSYGSIATISGIMNGTGSMHALPILTSSNNSPFFIRLNQVFLNQPDFELPIWTLAPNPAKDQFTIQTENYTGSGVLTTLLGQKIQTFKVDSNTITINISDLPKGIYLVTLGTTSKRIVID